MGIFVANIDDRIRSSERPIENDIFSAFGLRWGTKSSSTFATYTKNVFYYYFKRTLCAISFSRYMKYCIQLHILSHPKCLFKTSHPAFLAHLSRRLTRWAYRMAPSVRRPSSTISKIFFSETTWPILLKFYVDPSWVVALKVWSRNMGHVTKMAATPIYGKKYSKIFFSRTGRSIFMKLGM